MGSVSGADLERLTKPATETRMDREYRWQNMKNLLSFSLCASVSLWLVLLDTLNVQSQAGLDGVWMAIQKSTPYLPCNDFAYAMIPFGLKTRPR